MAEKIKKYQYLLDNLKFQIGQTQIFASFDEESKQSRIIAQ